MIVLHCEERRRCDGFVEERTRKVDAREFTVEYVIFRFVFHYDLEEDHIADIRRIHRSDLSAHRAQTCIEIILNDAQKRAAFFRREIEVAFANQPLELDVGVRYAHHRVDLAEPVHVLEVLFFQG